jgi:hypothetical protein
MLEGFAKEYVMHIFLGPLLYLPLGIFHCHLVYFIAIWYISLPFGIFHCHLVYFVVNWHIFLVLVCCTKKKSGNPAHTENFSQELRKKIGRNGQGNQMCF